MKKPALIIPLLAFALTAQDPTRGGALYKDQCATCHGDMSQATVAQPVVKFTMGTCVSCHRQRNASQDCATCHY